MNKTDARELIERQWTALESEAPSGTNRLRSCELPIQVHNGPIVLAVDHDGFRHVLLPTTRHSKVRQGLDGPVLLLRKRRLESADSFGTYADLACLRHDLDDLFTELCLDVVLTAERVPKSPLKALHQVLDRWKALLKSPGHPLGPEELAGLFAELTVLQRLLRKDSSAHLFWRGPFGDRHDFLARRIAVEVKATTRSEGRRPRIHGLDQLEAPEGGPLFLAWFRLHRARPDGAGSGLVETIAEVLRLCDDESAVLDLLARAGYRPADDNNYRVVGFTVTEERWYAVDADFPRLTTDALTGVPAPILDVEYTVDLSGEHPEPIPTERQTLHILDEMIRESV